MIDADAFRVEITVRSGPWETDPVARGRLACLLCNDPVVVWTAADQPTLGYLDRAAEHHRRNDCVPVR